MSPDSEQSDQYRHVPCMLAETLEILDPKPEDIYGDLTLGLGSHAAAILENTTAPALGLDWDEQMLGIAGERLSRFGERVKLVHSNFTRLPQVLEETGLPSLDICLLDAGVARPHLVDPERGMGFAGTTLDLRMDRRLPLTGAEFINEAPEQQLRDVLRLTQTPAEARRIAAAIRRRREQSPIASSKELAELIVDATRSRHSQSRRQPASAMLALRIHINEEIENLKVGVEAMARALRPGTGRMAVLVYHSLEFRAVRSVIERLERGHDVPPWMPEPPDAQPLIRRLVTKPLKPKPDAPDQCRSCRLFAAVAV